MIFCEFAWVRPLPEDLVAREKSLQEWERINRQEREAIATIKTISIEELRKWVATTDEQNQRFAELQSKIHQHEIDLAGPAISYILVAALAVLAVIGLVVFWLRDANSAAATTLENVAALAPDAMVRSVLIASLAAHKPITLVVDDKNDKGGAAALPGPPGEPVPRAGASGSG